MDERLAATLLIVIEGLGTVTMIADGLTAQPNADVAAVFPAGPRSKPDDGHDEEHSTAPIRGAVSALGATGISTNPSGARSLARSGAPSVVVEGAIGPRAPTGAPWAEPPTAVMRPV